MAKKYRFAMRFISPGVFTCGGWTIYHNLDGSYTMRKGSSILEANDRERLDELLGIHCTTQTLNLVKRYGLSSNLNR